MLPANGKGLADTEYIGDNIIIMQPFYFSFYSSYSYRKYYELA